MRHLSLAMKWLMMAGLKTVNPWVTEVDMHEAAARKEEEERRRDFVDRYRKAEGVNHWITGKPSTVVREMGSTNEIGWRMVGEVPPGAGKLKAATVFGGMLILAFERGVYRVDDAGKIVPIEFKP